MARWEREGNVYRWVGVGGFRWVLLHTPLGWLGSGLALKSGRSDLPRLMRNLNTAEGLHATGAAACLALAAVYLLTGHTAVGVWIVLAAVPLHVYPALLQRWTRGRVRRILRSRGARPRIGERSG